MRQSILAVLSRVTHAAAEAKTSEILSHYKNMKPRNLSAAQS